MTKLDINDPNYFQTIAHALGTAYTLAKINDRVATLSKDNTTIYLNLDLPSNRLELKVDKWEYLKSVPAYIKLQREYLSCAAGELII